jgi:cobalt-zinc-cadmium efflux system membrane fusion protein
MRAWIAALSMTAVLCAACREVSAPRTPDADSTAPSPSSTAGAASGAAAEALMCAEHGVPEAFCTKCHPELIASFQAKGDWCEEHGFPESVCPICNPGAPAAGSEAKAESGEAPADGTKVMFKTYDTARLAGLRTVAAVPGGGDAALTVTARIVYDASKVARVNARAPGVVLSVRADIGAKVKRGAPLAVIESAGVGADQSRLRAARSRAQVSEANLARVTKLHGQGIVPEVDVLEARKASDEAQADLEAARSALGMVGGTTEGSSHYTLSSPISGVVTSREVTIGRMVDTEDTLFEVVDVSTVWAEVDIPETDVAGISPHAAVTLHVEGLGDRTFSGALTYIAPEIDPRTRTARGRIPLANPEGALRVHMFGRARIARTGAQGAVLVPREAVQRAHDVRLVFVRLSEQVYEARRVTPGPADGDLVAVTGRVKPGDQVVTDGSFLLKTETLKGSIGAGCCPDVEKEH